MAAAALDDEFNKLSINKKSDINILLLGETGVGKSTFINALASYITFSSDFEKAEQKLDILIPSVISVEDKYGRSRKLVVGKTDQNETLKIGESATQDVKTYVFPIWNNQANVRIIDTPGMGDTRGIQQDNINSENILTYISLLDELHAICFLFRPDKSRSTVFFQYCIAQIFSRLDKSASKNIIFVFTGTRGTNYGPGDTMDILRKTVDEIRRRPPNVEIPIGRNIFCFDNESFKYLAAIKEKVEFSKSDREKNKESWKKSSSECWKLINYIVGDVRNKPLEPHLVKSTKAVNEARRLILQMAKPLADISEMINDNMNVLQRHKDNLEMENLSLEELKKQLYMPVINLEVIEQTQPVTVCASRVCAEVYKVGDVNKWHYKQRCHDPCYLTNVPKEIIGSPQLVHCAAMNGSKKCKKCACDFSVHMHIYYMTKTKNDTVKDDNVAKNINSKEKALESKRLLIENIKIRKTEFDDEQKIIINTCAKFAHFLENNAITPFSDAYKEYIEYLINREKSLGQMCNKGTLRHLNQLLLEYEAAKQVFHNTKQLGKSDVSPHEIHEGITDLYNLNHTGQKIKQLFECQAKSRGKEYKNTEYVHKSIPMQTAKNDKTKDKDKKTKDSDNKKTNDSDKKRGANDKKSTGSDRETRFQKRDNWNQNTQNANRNSDNYQFQTGSYQRPRDSNAYSSGYESGHIHYNSPQSHIPPLMGSNPMVAPNLFPDQRQENAYGYDINIHVNHPNASQYGTADPSYNNSQFQRYDNYSSQSPHYYSHTSPPYPNFSHFNDPRSPNSGFHKPPNSFGNYPSPVYDSRYHGSSNPYDNYQQNGYPRPQSSYPYGETSSHSYYPQSGNPHSGLPSENFHNQRQSSNRQFGNDRPRRNDRGNNFRGGRGKRGVNKNYKSGNQKKKTNNKEPDSDLDSSISSHASSDS